MSAVLDVIPTLIRRVEINEVGCWCWTGALEIADLAYRHAERQSRALEAKLRAFQSVGASVRSMYSGQHSGVGA